MDVLELARWQFAITTVYHFFFVPVSIGMSAFVAICQTAHWRTGKPVYDRMARFWGKLFLVVFALGVATGIVQEFQFGMNWSTYSRYVGDIFGAPLAMEGLAAFFVESTFLGLWIFGRGRMSPRLHSPASGWSPSARCCRRTSSSRRTPGCSIRSATSSIPRPGTPTSPRSGRC